MQTHNIFILYEFLIKLSLATITPITKMYASFIVVQDILVGDGKFRKMQWNEKSLSRNKECFNAILY